MAEELLSLTNLTVSLTQGRQVRPILEGVDLTVTSNRILGILGESGSGKTTLARAMVGWIAPPLSLTGGGIAYRGRDLNDPAIQRLVRAKIGFIGADPGNAFDPTIPVGHQIAEKLRTIRPEVTAAEARKQVVDWLDAVRIPSAATRYN